MNALRGDALHRTETIRQDGGLEQRKRNMR
jgi:hypothetical protein